MSATKPIVYEVPGSVRTVSITGCLEPTAGLHLDEERANRLLTAIAPRREAMT